MAATTITNPGEFVVPDELLTSKNYESWVVVMRQNLEQHSLWGCIESRDVNRRIDLRKDKEALEAIKMSCSPEMLPHIMYDEFAKEAWEWLALSAVSGEYTLEKVNDTERMLELAASAAARLESDFVAEVDKILTRRNYGKWKKYMDNVFLSKYLWNVSYESRSYKTKNHSILVIIRMSCGDEMFHYIDHEDDASMAWSKLENELGAAWNKLEEKLGATTPYYLHPIDHELLKVVVDDQLLTSSSNYENWEICTRKYLINEGLWGFLEEPEISDWVKDERALDAIKLSCTPEMKAYILYMDCAKNAWEKLATVAAISTEYEDHSAHLKMVKEAASIDLGKYSQADKVLIRSNYQEWKEYVTMLLRSQFLSNVVLPADHKSNRKTSTDYEIKEACALRIIKEACGRGMMPYIFRSKSPEEAMNSLRKACFMDPKDDYMKYSRLFHAVQKDEFSEQIKDPNGEIWRGAHKFFRDFPEALTAEITEDGATALHVAVRLGRVDFVRELLKLMTKAQLESKTHQGNTAIAIAAEGKNMEIVKMLVEWNPYLLLIGNEHQLNAVTIAAMNGNERIMRYLYPPTPKSIDWWSAINIASLLTSAARLDAFDIVRDLLVHFPDYALVQDAYGMTLLSVLAEKPSAFPSGNSGWIYWLAGTKMRGKVGIFSNLKYVPCVKQVLDCKKKYDHTAAIVQHICAMLLNLNPHQLRESLIYDAIHRSITHGIIEVFENLIGTNPYLEQYKDEHGRGLFQIAIMARQENIFRYISQMGARNQSLTLLDKFGNNALHCAAYWDPSSQLDKVHGPALRMQREIQWFLEVERVVPPRFIGMMNKKPRTGDMTQPRTGDMAQTPGALFSLQHRELAKEGEKWMKETAQACMIVTTLIATVMFAAAFTLPGGSDQNTGHPLYASTVPFKIFIVSDAVSLFSSCTSVLTFFAVLTSRYAERDFLTSLPKKMILGLSTLFVSIATMMITFATTLVIVLRGEASWVYIPVSILASIPVLLFGFLQLPLFVSILLSTYGRGIFHTKRIVLAPLTSISYS